MTGAVAVVELFIYSALYKCTRGEKWANNQNKPKIRIYKFIFVFYDGDVSLGSHAFAQSCRWPRKLGGYALTRVYSNLAVSLPSLS